MPSDSPRVLSYGPAASMVDGLAVGEAVALRDTVLRVCTDQHLPIDDVVIGARSVVVTHPLPSASRILELLRTLTLGGITKVALGASLTVVIPVRYDGEDLAHVARHCGLSIRDAVALHSGAKYVVEFCGFSPGFAYLAGLPAVLSLPRRISPRPRVPRGAVAIAAGYSAVYPRESPGGWHLLGITNFDLWNVSRAQPAALTPGDVVQFVDVT